MNEPEWLVYARRFVGLKEIPGSHNNPVIVDWLIRLRAWWRNDEVPWCGVYIAHVFSHLGYPIPDVWARARAWLDWGVKLSIPTVGCVVIYERGAGGHVGLVVGRDYHGNLMTLGGNQGNKVSIAPFSIERVLGYRWPNSTVVALASLPFVDSDGKVSANES